MTEEAKPKEPTKEDLDRQLQQQLFDHGRADYVAEASRRVRIEAIAATASELQKKTDEMAAKTKEAAEAKLADPLPVPE